MRRIACRWKKRAVAWARFESERERISLISARANSYDRGSQSPAMLKTMSTILPPVCSSKRGSCLVSFGLEADRVSKEYDAMVRACAEGEPNVWHTVTSMTS